MGFGCPQAVKVTNLGRIGQPEEIAGWVSFIVGDDAKYITGGCNFVHWLKHNSYLVLLGQTMSINGGMYYD